jgi:type III secretion protein V
MNGALRSLEGLPFDRLTRHPDLVLAAFVVALVAMMMVPLPPPLLDVLLATNLTLSALVLAAVLLSNHALSLSSFPSLLLLTTLFRLALNVSTTRLILSTGHAGNVVRAFGEIVLGGDIVVGVVVFMVITLVQFLVIAKGAERVAEVGARFTLDAMPGKQLAIDAGVRSGAISEEDGQEKRAELGRESQFYGAMDGAMKFVKGDAIAGLLITAINLIAGMIIGVVRFHLTARDAIDAYSILSVGDGLVSQIPALLVTLAAAMMTTRVAAKEKNASLGFKLKSELFGSARVLGVGAVFCFAIALLPHLPSLPFLACGTCAGIAAWIGHVRASRIEAEASRTRQAAIKKKMESNAKQVQAQQAITDTMAPIVVPISVELDPRLSAIVGLDQDTAEDSELVASLIPQLRDALYFETGVPFPGIRVRMVETLAPNTCVIRLKDVPIAVVRVSPEHALAVETPARLQRLRIAAEPTRHPMNGIECALIRLDAARVVADAGITVRGPASVIALHIASVLRAHARDFIGLQETSNLLERFEKVHPVLVKEVVPSILTLAQLADVFKRLVDESVSIRDLKSILEGIAQLGPHRVDTVAMTEHVRAALSMQIGFAQTAGSGRLSVVLLEPLIEDTIRSGIFQTQTGGYLALDPEIRRSMLLAIARTLEPVKSRGIRPVLLTSVEIRRYVRKLVEEDLPDTSVLSFQELPPQLVIQPLGRVALHEEIASEAA